VTGAALLVCHLVLATKLRAMQRLAQAQKSLLLLTQRLDEANRKLQELVHVDRLTGVASQRAFDTRLTKEWQRCQRLRAPLTIYLLRIRFDLADRALYRAKLGGRNQVWVRSAEEIPASEPVAPAS